MKEAKYEQFALGEYTICSMAIADSVIRRNKRSNIARGTFTDHNITTKQPKQIPPKGNKI